MLRISACKNIFLHGKVLWLEKKKTHEEALLFY